MTAVPDPAVPPLPHGAEPTHPLLAAVRDVRRRAVWLLAARGLGWWAAGTLLALTAAGAIDYWLRWEDAGLRTLITLAVVSLSAGGLWRALAPLLRMDNEVGIARRIESAHPQLRDRLTSAVEFVQGDRAVNSGSPALQSLVVEQAWRDAGQLNLKQCLQARPTWRAVVAALLVLAGAGAMAGTNPALARIAAQRFTAPWGAADWPRHHRLRYVDAPQRVVRGATATIRVEDQNGRLPEVGTLEILHAGQSSAEVVRERVLAQESALLATIENVTHSLQYRVLAGDDELPWTRLELVEPADVEAWSLTLEAPAYAGGATTEVNEQATTLLGSRLRFSARVSRPMQSAWLVASDRRRWPLAEQADRQEFALREPIPLQQSGTIDLWLECQELTGEPRRVGRQSELIVVLDTPPAISWEQPAEAQIATPASLLPLRGVAKDDVAVTRLEAVFEMANGARRLVDLLPAGRGDEPAGASAKAASFQRQLSLAGWGLRAGDPCRVMLRCQDARSDGSGLTETPWRQIRLVDSTQLLQWAASRQAEFYQTLERLLELQQSTRGRAAQLLALLQDADTMTPELREMLQSVNLKQRRIIQGLGVRRPRDSSGLLGMITAALNELELTGEAVEMRRRTAALRDTIADVVSRQVDDAERSLIAAVQSGTIESPALPAAGHLQPAIASQGDVIATLQSLLADAQQWSSFQQAAQELSRLIESQRALGDRMADSQLRQLTAPDDSSLKEAAATQADQQRSLARRMDKLLAGLSQLQRRLSEAEAATVRRAMDRARRRRLASLARESATLLAERRWGPALERHEQLLAGLKEVLEQLGAPQDGDATMSADEVLRQLNETEQTIRKYAEQWRQEPASRQDLEAARRLRDEVNRLADAALNWNPAAGEMLGTAGILMSRASEADAIPTARADAAESAAGQVADAASLLSAASNAPATLQQIMRSLDAIIGRQRLLRQAVLGLPDPAPAKDCLEIQSLQRALSEEIQTDPAWQESEILRAGLLQTLPAMRAAEEDLGAAHVEPAERNMRLALSRLEGIREALGAGAATPSGEPPASDDQTTQAAGRPDGNETELKLAELKVMLLMQEEIAQRTVELEQLKRRRPLSDAETEEQRLLAGRQGQLARWTEALLVRRQPSPAPPTAPADDPPNSSIDDLLETLK